MQQKYKNQTMKSTVKDFPIYRKYVGVETHFKILNEKEFIEIKRVGKQFVKHHVVAIQFPEMQFIKDMIDCYEGRWEEDREVVFNEIEKKTK